MIESYIRMFEKGAITAHHLALCCLQALDPSDPGTVLANLPDPILERIVAYIRDYQPGRMITNYGGSPTSLQVAVARAWIEANVSRQRAEAANRPPTWKIA